MESLIGHCLMFMDAETGDRSARNAAKPTFYPHPPTQLDAQGHPKPTSLPDIILFPEISSEQTMAPTTAAKRVILIDVTYTDDKNVHNRFEEKKKHHDSYVRSLRRRGWKTTLYPIIITYSGCVTSNLRAFLTRECKLTESAVNKFIRKLQAHTCSSNSKVVSTRQALKKQVPSAPPPPTGVG